MGGRWLPSRGSPRAIACTPCKRLSRTTPRCNAGFCGPGAILAAKVLLDENSEPTTAEIRDALAGNLCRCTGYTKMIAAVKEAAAVLRAEPQMNAPPPMIDPRTPERMKAWVLGGPDELRLVEKPVPRPGAAEVLVRIGATAVCGTDLEVIQPRASGPDSGRPAVQQELHARARIHGHRGTARPRR